MKRSRPDYRTAHLPEGEIVAAYGRGGTSLEALAAKYKVSFSPIKRIVRRAALTIRRDHNRKIVSEPTRDAIVDGYVRDQSSLKQLSKQHGLTEHVVGRVLGEAGVVLRPRGRYRKSDRKI